MPNLGFSLDRNYVATIRARRARLGCSSIHDVDSLITAAPRDRRAAPSVVKGLIFTLAIIAALAACLTI